MPQPKKASSLGANPSHQRQLLSNLAISLFDHERIKTTEAKAKLLKPYAERLITKAKKGTVHHRRQVLSKIEDREIVHKLFDEIGPRFSDRNGGYTRILKLGPRNGDAAPMVMIELVDQGVAPASEGEPTEETSRRRRFRAPRRRGAEDLPQDKPARSRAADAAAAGTGPGPDVEPHEDVQADTSEARLEAEEASTEASTTPAEIDHVDDTSEGPQKTKPGYGRNR